MPYSDLRASTWFADLTTVEQTEVRATIGALPGWIVDSLRRVGLGTIEVRGPEGSVGHLFSLSVLDFLARPAATSRRRTTPATNSRRLTRTAA